MKRDGESGSPWRTPRLTLKDILKLNDYHKLPSEYLKEDNSTIDKLIEEVNIDLNNIKDLLKNTADIYKVIILLKQKVKIQKEKQ